MLIRDAQVIRLIERIGEHYRTNISNRFIRPTLLQLPMEKQAWDLIETLTEKVEQYRRDEDALRSALISAERMKESILAEATQQRDILLRDAQQKAEKIVYEAESKIDREEVTLNALKQQVAAFKSEVLSIYKSHLEILSDLPDNPEDMNFGQPAGSFKEDGGIPAQDGNREYDQVFETYSEIPQQHMPMAPMQEMPINNSFDTVPPPVYMPPGPPPVMSPHDNVYGGQFEQMNSVMPYTDPAVVQIGIRQEPEIRYETYSSAAYGDADMPYNGQPAAVEKPQMEESVFASFSTVEDPMMPDPVIAEESRFGKLDFGENFSFGRD